MENLKQEVSDFIESVELTTKREFEYLSNNDWTKITSFEAREEEYKLQQLLTSRSLKNAETLYKKAKDELHHPQVKDSFSKFFSFADLHEERSEKYLQETDWTSPEFDTNLKKLEIEFQSTILKDITAVKEGLRKINYGGESLVVVLPIHGNIPAPLLMKEKLEGKYPEIKIFLNKRQTEENFIPLQLEFKQKENGTRKKAPKKPRAKGGRRPGY